MTPKMLFTIVAVVVIGLAVTAGWGSLTENNEAGFVKIVQVPITGTLNVKSEPGIMGQWFGSVTEYKQAGTYRFSEDSDASDSAQSPPVEVRFNDGGIAGLSGNARFELPLERDAMILIHSKFRSYPHIARTLVQPAIAEALILTASLMSAEESYSGRRAEFAQLALDQVLNGIYITEWEEKEVIDAATGEHKKKRVVFIKKDADGVPVRKPNPLKDFDIRISQFFIDKDFAYEDGVLQQIRNSRDAMMKTVFAKAEKAQQDRLTAEAQGQANVMTAKYEAEVNKEKAVVVARQMKEVAETQAEQRLEVAKFDKLAAEQYRDAQLLRAEGDAQYKERVMKADGALEQKLQAWVDVNKMYASAIQSYQGAWVPGVVMGGAGGTNGAAGAMDLVTLLTAKTAKELALDLSVTGQPQRVDSK